MDRTDFEILRNLQNNARLANKVLADRVGLAASSCMERVRRLRSAGALRSAHQVISRDASGIGLEAMIFVRLQQHDRDRVEAFRRYAEGLEEVASVFHVGGEHDFVIHVAVRDSEHLRDLAMDAFTARGEVSHIETHLIFARSDWPDFPIYQPASSPKRDRHSEN